ncbi:hypothetical protein FACS18949_07140 [Clostridia bacterium]|nr:hypothetical protein FACS189425_05290 [Clostridia bacterium]GHV33368.1 hypothetical protein FACS18949_07140 [Clostridia bacterium]
MNNSKLRRTISNTVFGLGVTYVVTLALIAAIGANAVPNPDAMIPFT